MKKFRHWLIKKLGGFVEQNNITLKPPKIYREINDIETIMVSVRVVDFYSPIVIDKIYKELYNKISAYMLDNYIGSITREYDAVNKTSTFTLKLKVAVNNGTKKEHN